jgi:hypothetical protein
LQMFLLSPAELAWSRVISSANLTGIVQWLRLALSKGPNWVGVFSPLQLKTETDPVSKTSCFYSAKHRTMDKVPVTLCAMHHRQNPIKSIHKLHTLAHHYGNDFCCYCLIVFCIVSFVSFWGFSSGKCLNCGILAYDTV